MFIKLELNLESVETKHRRVFGKLPTAEQRKKLDTIESYESRSMQGQFPLLWHKAKGHSIYDDQNRKWIDFTSTIFVTNTGHSNTNVIKAVKYALDQSLIHTYAYPNEIRARFLKALIEFTPPGLDKAFLLSAGTEATEAALKLMRLYSNTSNKNRPGIVSLRGNWHGRTMGAQLLSSNEKQKSWIGHEDPNIHFIDFPYPWLEEVKRDPENFANKQIENLENRGLDLKKDICGIMLETFQGWGALFYPKAFIKRIEGFAKANDILICFDEMQAGFARTGKKFGFEHYDVSPDLICVGKGMASGFPLSAVVGKKQIMDLPEVGNMSSTHSANPICCAAGLATIEEIQNKNLVNQSEKLGEILSEKLESIQKRYPNEVELVTSHGLIGALILKTSLSNFDGPKAATEIAIKCLQKGLLVVHTGRESIKIGPPLSIDREALIEGMEILIESSAEVLEGRTN